MFYKELVNKELFNDNSQRNKSHKGLIIEKNQTGDLFLSNRLKTSFVEKKWKYSKQGTVEYFNDNSLFLIRSKVD